MVASDSFVSTDIVIRTDIFLYANPNISCGYVHIYIYMRAVIAMYRVPIIEIRYALLCEQNNNTYEWNSYTMERI